jgi:hypothetical protein
MRQEFGIDFQRPDVGLQRPDFQEAFPRALEDIVVALRALRIVALDVQNVTPPNQSHPHRRIRRI